MPCFKGLAVSIHVNSIALPEYSIQKQGRQSRISCYIAVPPPRFTAGSDRPEQPNFAISITLLTPGSKVPYSEPVHIPGDPQPRYKLVGGLPGYGGGDRGRYSSAVTPYIPLTSSSNETVAAYIHFDGRPKEEVATLLRRGVETWVNSRWVGIPEAEGGGLAEREFLFREVGLERWLNGLDLKGPDKEKAAKIEQRKLKLEKKRKKKLQSMVKKDRNGDEEDVKPFARPLEGNGTSSDNVDKKPPLDSIVGGNGQAMESSDDSEDEMPEPEATGQIKVSLFRVMASGEIKKGEYSPSFDAHDDEDEGMQEKTGGDPGVDHTTSFAKPKQLDPTSISTQTVTGIDDPSKPFAIFTFFYRGDRQLQKMGINTTPESDDVTTTGTAKRKSRTIDLSALDPLKTNKGTVGFAGYRDQKQRNGVKRRGEDDMDSDVEDDGPVTSAKRSPKVKKEPTDQDTNGTMDEDSKDVLSPEELSKRAELAESVKKMQLKRQHSFDPSQGRHISQNASQDSSFLSQNTPVLGSTIETATSPPSLPQSQASRLSESQATSMNSPFKKQRASISAQPEIPPLNFNPPAPATTANVPASAISAPDISFMRTEAQPNFSSLSGGKVNETVGNAEDASAVPLPPPTVATSTTVKHEGKGMDMDEEL